jgi:hypothetical protein
MTPPSLAQDLLFSVMTPEADGRIAPKATDGCKPLHSSLDCMSLARLAGLMLTSRAPCGRDLGSSGDRARRRGR